MLVRAREVCMHSPQLLHQESLQDGALGADPPGFIAAVLTLSLGKRRLSIRREGITVNLQTHSRAVKTRVLSLR